MTDNIEDLTNSGLVKTTSPEKVEEEYGIVYLLTNPCMPGLVKIGKTSKKELNDRMKELYKTGVPTHFECQYACKTKNYSEIEKALHTAFEPQRINPNREFFRIEVKQAKVILELFNHNDAAEEVTEEVTEEIQNDLKPEEKEAVQKLKRPRPPLNFFEMGLHKGDELVWKDDTDICVTIVSGRSVNYNGDEYSLSALSAQLKGSSVKNIAPTPHWLYEGRVLSDIYDETYPFED